MTPGLVWPWRFSNKYVCNSAELVLALLPIFWGILMGVGRESQQKEGGYSLQQGREQEGSDAKSGDRRDYGREYSCIVKYYKLKKFAIQLSVLTAFSASTLLLTRSSSRSLRGWELLSWFPPHIWVNIRNLRWLATSWLKRSLTADVRDWTWPTRSCRVVNWVTITSLKNKDPSKTFCDYHDYKDDL